MEYGIYKPELDTLTSTVMLFILYSTPIIWDNIRDYIYTVG